jgi:hypothetical protein
MKIIKVTVENDTGEAFTREQVGETVLWYSHDIEIDSANSRELEYQYSEIIKEKPFMGQSDGSSDIGVQAEKESGNLTKSEHNKLEQLNQIFIILENIRDTFLNRDLSEQDKKEKLYLDVQKCFPIIKAIAEEIR